MDFVFSLPQFLWWLPLQLQEHPDFLPCSMTHHLTISPPLLTLWFSALWPGWSPNCLVNWPSLFPSRPFVFTAPMAPTSGRSVWVSHWRQTQAPCPGSLTERLAESHRPPVQKLGCSLLSWSLSSTYHPEFCLFYLFTFSLASTHYNVNPQRLLCP